MTLWEHLHDTVRTKSHVDDCVAGDGEFQRPTGVAVLGDGRLAICDSGATAVHRHGIIHDVCVSGSLKLGGHNLPETVTLCGFFQATTASSCWVALRSTRSTSTPPPTLPAARDREGQGQGQGQGHAALYWRRDRGQGRDHDVLLVVY